MWESAGARQSLAGQAAFMEADMRTVIPPGAAPRPETSQLASELGASKGEGTMQGQGSSSDQAARISFAAPLTRRQLAAVLPSTASPDPGPCEPTAESLHNPPGRTPACSCKSSTAEAKSPSFHLTCPNRSLRPYKCRFPIGAFSGTLRASVQPFAKRIKRAKELFTRT